MYILDVILISVRSQIGVLSYFKDENVPIGSIIEVPFRSKNVRALVIDGRAVNDAKVEIKNHSFALRKAKGVIAKSFFDKSFIETLKSVSEFYVTDINTVFSTITLSSIFKSGVLESAKTEDKIKINQPGYIIQAPDKERGDYYRSSIREAFAKGQSVLFIVPTQNDSLVWFEILRKGIEQYVIRLNGALTEKTQKISYNKISREKHPVLVIGTPVILSVARKDLGFVILEHESSPYYRSINRPYIDGRLVAKIFAEKSGIKILSGDSLLSFETLAKHESGELTEVRPLLYRQHSSINYEILDMREEDKINGFSVLGKSIIDLINSSKEQTNFRVLLFSFRSGLYSSSVCRDCGSVEKCSNCGQTLMVSTEKESKKRIMLCGRCGKREKADRLCSICGSWDLVPLGIGTERIYEEVKNLVTDDTEIVLIDRETAKTKKSLSTLVTNSEKAKKVVVIATEMALDHLQKKFDHVVVVSFDTLFSIPLYDANEHIAHLTIDLQEKATKSLIIQTRNPANEVIRGFSSHNIPNFIREDIDTRKTLGYPPFKTLIKAKWQGSIDLYPHAAKLTEVFEEYSPYRWHKILPNKNHELYMLLKIEPKIWYSTSKNKENADIDKLHRNLQNLGEGWSIEINPSNIL